MPFRAELKRPDLKGTFRCSICQKIFCHSSSLSRHRMQAHFKSYTCTLCRKEITSNETLRSHMYKQHQISRMFMCRCCNWAFPDKTSLHMHMQAKEEGKNVNVPIIGKGGSGGPMPMGMAGGHGQPPMSLSHLSSLMSPPATVPTSMSNGMGGGSNNIFPQNPLSMVSQQPRPDDIMATLRERFMLNSMLAQAQPTLRLAAWLSQFPKVDASGVGRLGGSLNLRSEPNENEQGCNNNNHGGDAGSTGGEMAVKEESDGDINVEDLGDEVVDGQQCMDTNEHATNPSDDEGERNLVISDEMERTSDGVGTAPSDTSDEAKEASSENVHQQLNGQESLSTVLGRMPALRNAINSSSPLSSLLYKKRLDSALKRDNNTTKSNTESNQTNNQMPLSLGGVDMGGSCAPPTMTTSTASLLASMIGAAAAAASSGVEMPLAATTTHNATTNCSNNTSGSQSYSPTDSNSSGSPQHHHHHTHQPNGSTDQQQQQSQNAQQSNGDMCYQCSMMKGRLAIAQNRSRYLESRTASLQADVLRYGARASSAENNGRQFERECQMLREQNETLQKKLIECQEKTLMFMQGTGHSNPVIVSAFLNEILKTTFLG